jgi:SAM-dependent methyltransferase
MATRPYLDYYIANKIIPVNQDLSNIDLHMKRRSILYHYLHIPPAAVRGRKVLEIGPGTGDNAIFTASLLPDTYVMVDGNPFSIAALKERIADPRYAFSKVPHLDWAECDFFAYQDERRYDLVLCEGIVPGQAEGARFLRHAASFVDARGLLVLTTESATSILSEVCRRLVKPIFAKRADSPKELSERLEAFIAPHLNTLPGRSRLVGDWIKDNILQPWPRGVVFTIDDTIDAVGDHFDVYGTSPQFIQDFRWYKAAAVDDVTINDVARQQTAYWSPIFIDYRFDAADFRGFDGLALEKECLGIFLDAHEAWETGDLALVAACVGRIGHLGDWIAPTFPRTAESIRDFVASINALLAGDLIDAGEFKSWFGRGQQYVSCIRRD